MVEIGIETIRVQFLCVKVFMVIAQVNKSSYLQANKYFNAELSFCKNVVEENENMQWPQRPIVRYEGNFPI